MTQVFRQRPVCRMWFASWSASIALIALLVCWPAAAQEQPSEADLEALNERISGIQQEMSKARKRRSDIQQQMETTEQSIATINDNISELNTQIEQQEHSLVELQEEKSGLNRDINQQQSLIAEYIRSAYQEGREEYLKLLLNQQKIDQVARNLRYYQYFNRARSERIATFQATVAKLDAVESEIIEATTQLRRQQQSLQEEQASLAMRKQERESLLAELDRELENRSAELLKLEGEREEIARLLEEISRAINNLGLGSDGRTFSQRRGELPWPLQGRLLNSYGSSYDLGDLTFQGVTIAAAEGDPVMAIHSGRVVFADWFSSQGLLLIIDHGDGYMSLYARNQLLYKSVGDWVQEGEMIAAAGNTGGHKQTGVYFEIRHNGQSQDPVRWCSARR